MRIYLISCLLIGSLLCTSCSQNTDDEPDIMDAIYFPPNDRTAWESQNPEGLNWDMDALNALTEFLEANDTRAFIILKDGKIVVEEYYGKDFIGTDDFDQNSFWYWASAGKSLTSVLMGIAQMENKLDINDPSSDYLGTGWSSLTSEQEKIISIRNHLSMTTGLNYKVSNFNCRTPECLTYKAPPSTEWFYYNAPYLLNHQIIENATQTSLENYTEETIYNKIGMNGFWRRGISSNVHWSTARDMARFGLLVENEGIWDSAQVYQGSYFTEMRERSQNLNSSYGFLWWLNGKNDFILPQSETSFSGALVPDAPADMFSALGKDGQIIDIVPSQNLVVVRMGGSNGEALIPTQFSREMWALINEVIY